MSKPLRAVNLSSNGYYVEMPSGMLMSAQFTKNAMENSSAMEHRLEIFKLYDFLSLNHPSQHQQPTLSELQQYSSYQVSYTLCHTDYIHLNRYNAWMFDTVDSVLEQHSILATCTTQQSRLIVQHEYRFYSCVCCITRLVWNRNVQEKCGSFTMSSEKYCLW